MLVKLKQPHYRYTHYIGIKTTPSLLTPHLDAQHVSPLAFEPSPRIFLQHSHSSLIRLQILPVAFVCAVQTSTRPQQPSLPWTDHDEPKQRVQPSFQTNSDHDWILSQTQDEQPNTIPGLVSALLASGPVKASKSRRQPPSESSGTTRASVIMPTTNKIHQEHTPRSVSKHQYDGDSSATEPPIHSPQSLSTTAICKVKTFSYLSRIPL